MLHKTREGDSKLILMVVRVLVVVDDDYGDGVSSYVGKSSGDM